MRDKADTACCDDSNTSTARGNKGALRVTHSAFPEHTSLSLFKEFVSRSLPLRPPLKLVAWYIPQKSKQLICLLSTGGTAPPGLQAMGPIHLFTGVTPIELSAVTLDL